MVLGALEKILDIEFKPDIDIRDVSLVNIEQNDKFQKDGRTLKLNVSELSKEERKELLDLPPEQLEAEHRVLRESEYEEVTTIEEGYDEDIDDVLDYFDGYLSDQYLTIIEAGLYLDILIEEENIPKKEIRKKKRDIATRHGPDAYYLASLAAAGYFHPNGGLRDLFVSMGLNKQYDKYNFQQELEGLVDDKILCVFVEEDKDIPTVTQEVRGRLARYQRRDPIHEWLDVRGIGNNCIEIIDGVVDNLEEEYIGIDYDRWTEDGYRATVRIHPHSLPPIE